MDFQAFLNDLLITGKNVGLKLLYALVVFFVGRVVIKWIAKLMKKSKFAQKHDATVVRFLQNFVNISLHVVLVVSIIGILGVPLASVVTVIASAGVAIGLALQGALSNVAGGIMILLFRPFRLGDYVETAGQSGTVNDIGIFYTVLTTPDNKVVTVPNGSVMGSSVVNYSMKDTRRVDFVFNVAYGTDVEKVKAILLDIAGKHELVLKDPAPFCRLSKQNESSIDFTVRVWAASKDYWQVNFDILETVTARFAEEGIEIPFNQLDVHVTK